MMDMRHLIQTELERNWGWAIDNKTAKRIAELLKNMGLILMHHFEIKFVNDSWSSSNSEFSEQSEWIEDSDGSEFRLRKRDLKDQRKNDAKNNVYRVKQVDENERDKNTQNIGIEKKSNVNWI